uniref:HTH_48 domain-containing protein n=1 Tax=Anopheles funestus TaxID=62324 RepID=A0A182RL81_ANOFN
MELTREHFRAIIFHNVRRGLYRQDCFDELKSLYCDEAPSYTTVKNWYNEFNRGRRSIKDKFREGRPKTLQNTFIRSSRVTDNESMRMSPKQSNNRPHVATEQRRTINSEWYATICLLEIFGEVRKTNNRRRFILHHDNASSHTLAQTIVCLAKTSK